MLRNKKLLQLIISAVMALIFVNIYLKNKEQDVANRYAMAEVLVASRDIPPNMAISPGYVEIREVPQKFMEPGAILVKEPNLAMNRVVGKVTAVAIPAGAQILVSNINSPSKSVTGVAPMIPPGKR